MRPEDSVPDAAPRTRRELREAERQAQLAAASAGSSAGSAPASAGPVVTAPPVTSRRAARLSAGSSAPRSVQPAAPRPAPTTPPTGRMPAWTSGTDIRPSSDVRTATPGRRSVAASTVGRPAAPAARTVAPVAQPGDAGERPEPRGTARDHAITPTAVTSSLSPRAAMPTARRPHAPGQPDTPAAGQGVAPRPVTPPAGLFHAVAPQAAAPQGAVRAWTASRVDAGTGPVAPLADAATTAIPRTAAPLPTVATATVPEQSGSAATPTPSSTTSAPAPGAPTPSAPVPSTVSQDRTHEQPAASAPGAGAVRATSRRQSTGRNGSSRPEPGRRRRPARAATRLGVLAALAGVTVVIPVSQGAIAGTEVLSGAPLDKATLPSTVSALAAAPASILPPASLVPGEGAIAARAAADAASRSESRSLLPGCDPRERSAGSNGLLPAKDLCTLWDGHTRLRADAAASLAEFNAAYVARFGADMCLASGYRTLAEQRSVKASRGSLAAPPGKSNHGWGLAVDFCSQLTSGERWAWLNANAKAFGWENPAWALPGGSGPHERWHWEYTKGVKADGEYYGS